MENEMEARVEGSLRLFRTLDLRHGEGIMRTPIGNV